MSECEKSGITGDTGEVPLMSCDHSSSGDKTDWLGIAPVGVEAGVPVRFPCVDTAELLICGGKRLVMSGSSKVIRPENYFN